MFEVNCRSFLSEFNISKFLVYISLFIFAITLGLKLDNILHYNYFVAFLPLWILELIIFFGFLTGILSFFCRPPSRTDIQSRNEFLSMVFCFLEHCLLTGFEIFCCYKLEIKGTLMDKQLSWLLMFSPLFLLSFFTMAIAVWAIRHDRSFEFELLFSVNIIQFVFASFKLDGALNWSWMIVFVPTWIVFSLCFIGTFYSLTLAIFIGRSPHLANVQRRSHFFSAISHMLLTIPLLCFFIFLADKLDALESPIRRFDEMPFMIVVCPLLIFLIASVLMSFGNKSGNTWWFGMRKPFCNFIFESLPCLQQYANISYRFGTEEPDNGVLPERQVLSRGTPARNPDQVQMLRMEDRTNPKLVSPNSFIIEYPD